MIKTPQILIALFLGMLGIAMLVHFWGEFTISSIISDVVGFILIVVAFIIFALYFRRKNEKMPENQ